MSARDLPRQLGERPKNILRLAREIAAGGGLRTHEVFVDFVEASAISFSNAVDLAQKEVREQRYLQIMQRYKPEQVARFPQMLGELMLALEEGSPELLGAIFMAAEFGDEWRGQFFTPYEISYLMAKVVMGDVTAEQVAARGGFLMLCEPACGAGGMVIASAQALREQGLNPQQQLHVTATDIAAACVHMTYVQLTLHHIPAIVQLGNSLSLQIRETWYTPAHILGGWNARLRHRAQVEGPRAPLATVPSATSGTPEAKNEQPSGRPQMVLF